MTMDKVVALAERIVQQDSVDDRPEALRKVSAVDGAARSCEVYHRFLFEWARLLQPKLVVETGTDRGFSAVHFAMGCPSARVVSIDNRSACSTLLRFLAKELGLSNIEAITADSLEAVHQFRDGSIDILFLDSLHTCEHLSKEIELYVPKVRRPQVVFVDDITMDDEISRGWSRVTYQKRSIAGLHGTGFGVFEV